MCLFHGGMHLLYAAGFLRGRPPVSSHCGAGGGLGLPWQPGHGAGAAVLAGLSARDCGLPFHFALYAAGPCPDIYVPDLARPLRSDGGGGPGSPRRPGTGRGGHRNGCPALLDCVPAGHPVLVRAHHRLAARQHPRHRTETHHHRPGGRHLGGRYNGRYPGGAGPGAGTLRGSAAFAGHRPDARQRFHDG